MKAAITFLIMCICVVAFMDRALDAATHGEVNLIMGWVDYVWKW